VYDCQLPIRITITKAIISPDNERERAAVRQVVAQRGIITTPARGTSQMILYNPIEHIDFVHRLIVSQPGALDYFCGRGYQQVYQRQESSGERDVNNGGQALDDMLLACLMQSGAADGYVKYTVQVHASLSRRTNGVAAQYRNEPRILSDFLWLPILERVGNDNSNSRKKKKNEKAAPTVPSTALPYAMTQYLLATVDPATPEWRYRQEWEEFLYTVIQREADKWALLTAVCSDKERTELAETARLVATSCRQDNTNCCCVFDTTLRPK
jgi:hypothetical protein